ncbi:MAG: hypothetical protein PF692_09780 [Kiritimatiellae bacterium]|jgi:hypothetical protein|nr:hypothetical protein [Kiritimatiellia bacterium]
MKKRKKIFLIVVGVFLGVIIAINIIFSMFLEEIVNQQLSSRLAVSAYVEDVDLAILRGRVRLQNLVIREPLENEGENFLSVGELVANISLLSLLSDTIKIQSVSLKDTHVNVITPQTNLFNFMLLMPIDVETNQIDVATKKTIVTNELVAIDQGIATLEEELKGKSSRAVLIEKVSVRNLNITYKDYNLCKPALYAGLTNINVNVKNVILNGKPDKKMHSQTDLTCDIMQPGNTGYLGVWAETGIIGADADIPAVNAIVVVNGLNLNGYKQIIPNGVVPALGGSILDIKVVSSVAQNYLNVNAKFSTVGNRFEVLVGGTPDAPSVGLSDILASLGLRGVMSVANPVGNVGKAGLNVGTATFDTGTALVKGTGTAVANVGVGLFKTVRSTVTGDFKSAGHQLVDTGTGAVGGVVSTVTNTTVTAGQGVLDTGGKFVNSDDAKKWIAGVEARKDKAWKESPMELKEMPFPSAK